MRWWMRALSDAGSIDMMAIASFWHILQCLAFGAGYFAKIAFAKALSEMKSVSEAAPQPLEIRVARSRH